MSIKDFLYKVQNEIEDEKTLNLKSDFYERKNILDLRILVCVDVSGSITPELYRMFMNTLDQIRGVSVIKVLETDSEVVALYDYVGGAKVVRLRGGGGTDFNEAFSVAQKMNPSVIVFMTDGEVFGEEVQDPGIPTAWILTGNGRKPYDFGEVVHTLPKVE
jgi:predicted metal-dependent peptidase